MRSIGFISSSLEEVVAFLIREEFTDVTDGAPEIVIGPRSRSPDEGLEFGECHFDGIKIGAVGVGGIRKGPSGAFSPNNGTETRRRPRAWHRRPWGFCVMIDCPE